MSDEPNRFTTADYVFSALSAFAIVAGGAVGVAMVATHGVLNREGLIGSCALGVVAAAKDFRALRRLPAVKTNGAGDTTIEEKKG